MKIASILIKFNKPISTNNTKDQRLSKISQERERKDDEPVKTCAEAKRDLCTKIDNEMEIFISD